jgi:hypothetical protein
VATGSVTELVQDRTKGALTAAPLALLCGAALVRGEAAATTDAGRVGLIATLGSVTVIIAVTILWWWRQPPDRIEVSADAISRQSGGASTERLLREWGDTVELVVAGSFRYRYWELRTVGSRSGLSIRGFSRKLVCRAVVDHGWTLAGTKRRYAF